MASKNERSAAVKIQRAVRAYHLRSERAERWAERQRQERLAELEDRAAHLADRVAAHVRLAHALGEPDHTERLLVRLHRVLTDFSLGATKMEK